MFDWLIRMFGFFKRNRAGKNGKSGKKELVNINNAQGWLLEKTGKELKKLSDELDQQFEIILSDIKAIKKRMVLLEDANVPEISPEDVEELKSAKAEFINNLEILIRKVFFAEETSFSTAREYAEKNKSTIKNFVKDNAKIKDRLAAHFTDVENINTHIDSIAARIEKVAEISNNELAAKVEKIKHEIEKINELVEKKNNYSEMISENEEKFEKFKNEKDASENRVSELIKSKEYIEFTSMQEKIDELEKKLTHAKKAVKADFIAIDTTIKKFNEIEKEHESILELYRKDPIEALILDRELEIIKALKKIASRIDEIEPEAKRKEKILGKINAIDELYFQRFMDEKDNAEFDRNGLKRRLTLVTAKKEIDDLEYKMKHLDDKMKTLSKDITKLNNALEKTDVEDLKEKLEKELEDLTGKGVELEIQLMDEEDVE